LALNWKKLDI